MKDDIYILVVEDEAEVLDAIVHDIEVFEKKFPVEMADSAEEARKIIDEIIEEGGRFGLLLCDHILPGENGVELLIAMQKRQDTTPAKKVLITGQAGLDDTVKAVNQAGLNHYIAKPWGEEELQDVVRHQLTDYVLEQCENPMVYMELLESDRIADAIRSKKSVTDR